MAGVVATTPDPVKVRTSVHETEAGARRLHSPKLDFVRFEIAEKLRELEDLERTRFAVLEADRARRVHRAERPACLEPAVLKMLRNRAEQELAARDLDADPGVVGAWRDRVRALPPLHLRTRLPASAGACLEHVNKRSLDREVPISVERL